MAKRIKIKEKDPKRTEISTLGEFGLIKHLTKKFELKNASSKLGIGDDAAVIDNKGDLTVVSTDLLIEGIHFDLVYTPLKHLGYKSVVVNLSDIYAMNAIPQQITYSIGVSNRFSVEALNELYEGIRIACDKYTVDLVGGDTTSSLKGLIISVTAVGVGDKKSIVRRNTAKVGDSICVTGDLGGAYLGLQLLEREKEIFLDDSKIQPDFEKQDFLIRRFLMPEAKQEIIDFFHAEKIIPTAMIDISDGLSSELLHICQDSGVGGNIYDVKIPIENETKQLAFKFDLDPTTCALNGGEEYELLFTIKEKDLEKIAERPDITIIGMITEKKDGIKLVGNTGNKHDITAQGWDPIKE
ncbi:MAG: thiamine-phosphate kinase [Bacteroidetes bacterium]|nr:thiamine-phosphate kinase [Bacteroidota bacterium]